MNYEVATIKCEILVTPYYTPNFQFSTRLKLQNMNIDIVHEAKILGTIVKDDLKWDANCSYLVRKF